MMGKEDIICEVGKGHHKCRESWPDRDYERIYNLLLDLLLLVLPLVALVATYTLITRTLHQGSLNNGEVEVYLTANGSPSSRRSGTCPEPSAQNTAVYHSRKPCGLQPSKQSFRARHLPTGLRRSNAEKSLRNKRRVIKMLCAVVLEFFVCWTPLYVINTIALFKPEVVYHNLGYTAISFFQLLAYSSSCCNPITYCFMNSSFRKSFLSLFRCRRKFKSKNMSEVSVSECSVVTRSQKWLQDTRSCAEHL